MSGIRINKRKFIVYTNCYQFEECSRKTAQIGLVNTRSGACKPA